MAAHDPYNFTIIGIILAYAPALYSASLIHECGHAIAARSLGWKIKRWIFRVGGDFAIVVEPPPDLDTHWRNIIVSLAGIAVNLLAAISTILVFGIQFPDNFVDGILYGFTNWFIFWNLLDVVVNLYPQHNRERGLNDGAHALYHFCMMELARIDGESPENS